MPVRLANLGYLALGKETTKGTAVVPTIFVPLYDDNFTTKINMDDDNPIIGQKMMGFAARQGMRTHMGDLTVLAEPNTAGHLFNMLMTQGSPSGAGPYTHPFTLDPVTDPKSYTMDICTGQVVQRFVGAEISQVDINFDKNKMTFKLKVSALASFIVREVASVSGAGPTTITLKTNYDPTPTNGLVAGDLIRAQAAAGGASIDSTVTSITATTIVEPANMSSLVAGDLIFIRAQVPSYTLRTPFMWGQTEFRFGATAAAALSAAQTRLEDGSKWTLMHKFEKDDGALRSGAFDPAALNRTQGDAELTAKMFFDTLDDFNRFLTLSKRACVVRHWSEGQSLYELRVTLNNIVAKEAPTPMKSGDIIYAEFKFAAFYDTSDAQGLGVTVINNLPTM